MYIYHALINALGAHMIHINQNMIFCTHVEHSPTKTIYIKYHIKKKSVYFNHPSQCNSANYQCLLIKNKIKKNVKKPSSTSEAFKSFCTPDKITLSSATLILALKLSFEILVL